MSLLIHVIYVIHYTCTFCFFITTIPTCTISPISEHKCAFPSIYVHWFRTYISYVAKAVYYCMFFSLPIRTLIVWIIIILLVYCLNLFKNNINVIEKCIAKLRRAIYHSLILSNLSRYNFDCF
jgi:hypothetical protein